MVDDDYNFTFVDIGANSRASDSAVFRDSKLNQGLENKSIGLPENAVIVGDDAFPLRFNLLKPYSRRLLSEEELIFYYRLSRARRVSENTFGILVWRFGVFLRAINQTPDRVDKIVWAACAIHNWLRQTSASTYLPPKSVDVEDTATRDVIPGQWRGQVGELAVVNLRSSNNYRFNAEKIRKRYAEYFVGEGALPWQLKKIGRKI
ncbi:unnamed protein product [Lasius platythorax]|uniref:DDE Tnp4 domain-containing protein n=1 Tax=Lasius platythorax TaxID=488582 RepID=A0AAV2MXA4_9HYME